MYSNLNAYPTLVFKKRISTSEETSLKSNKNKIKEKWTHVMWQLQWGYMNLRWHSSEQPAPVQSHARMGLGSWSSARTWPHSLLSPGYPPPTHQSTSICLHHPPFLNTWTGPTQLVCSAQEHKSTGASLPTLEMVQKCHKTLWQHLWSAHKAVWIAPWVQSSGNIIREIRSS